ncbi:hypothetical protein QUB63_22855 [Microcoleus sp. ARI1-B5]
MNTSLFERTAVARIFFLLGRIDDVGPAPSVDRDFTRLADAILRAAAQIFAEMTASLQNLSARSIRI